MVFPGSPKDLCNPAERILRVFRPFRYLCNNFLPVLGTVEIRFLDEDLHGNRWIVGDKKCEIFACFYRADKLFLMPFYDIGDLTIPFMPFPYREKTYSHGVAMQCMIRILSSNKNVFRPVFRNNISLACLFHVNPACDLPAAFLFIPLTLLIDLVFPPFRLNEFFAHKKSFDHQPDHIPACPVIQTQISRDLLIIETAERIFLENPEYRPDHVTAVGLPCCCWLFTHNEEVNVYVRNSG